jgi:hypothetical protein
MRQQDLADKACGYPGQEQLEWKDEFSDLVIEDPRQCGESCASVRLGNDRTAPHLRTSIWGSP